MCLEYGYTDIMYITSSYYDDDNEYLRNNVLPQMVFQPKDDVEFIQVMRTLTALLENESKVEDLDIRKIAFEIDKMLPQME